MGVSPPAILPQRLADELGARSMLNLADQIEFGDHCWRERDGDHYGDARHRHIMFPIHSTHRGARVPERQTLTLGRRCLVVVCPDASVLSEAFWLRLLVFE